MVQTKMIRRYANRKLYDTETSKYTTLKEIMSVVASGVNVIVTDNVSGNDITGTILLSAIVETEQDLNGQTSTLLEILRAGGLSKYVGILKEKASDAFDNGVNAEAENE